MASKKSSSKHGKKASKNVSKKASTASKKAASKKSKVAKAKPASLKEWLGTFHTSAKAVMAAGAPVGACLVSDPHTGTENCILVDQKTCSALNGTFIDGPCGGG